VGERRKDDFQFNAQVGATAQCTSRLLLNSIHPEQQGMKHGIYANAWFGHIWTATEVALRGHKGIFQIKPICINLPKELN
jgi:hypothetical protein